VIGTGGIGGPYGASLAKARADVTFVGRCAHLAAIRENGLRVEGDRGETHIQPAQATDDIANSAPSISFCPASELWDVERVAEQIRRSLGRRPP
jgi:2-dehydropantoate 2-reductase